MKTTSTDSNATVAQRDQYSIAWKLNYAKGKLGLIPAFGDSIGKNVNKAELALAGQYLGGALEMHAELLAALEKQVKHTEQLARTVNDFAARLNLGNKVHAEDFTDQARAAIAKARPSQGVQS